MSKHQTYLKVKTKTKCVNREPVHFLPKWNLKSSLRCYTISHQPQFHTYQQTRVDLLDQRHSKTQKHFIYFENLVHLSKDYSLCVILKCIVYFIMCL